MHILLDLVLADESRHPEPAGALAREKEKNRIA